MIFFLLVRHFRIVGSRGGDYKLLWHAFKLRVGGAFRAAAMYVGVHTTYVGNTVIVGSFAYETV